MCDLCIMEKMKTHGGAMWNALFLLVRDYDDNFIKDFVKRLPCETCSRGFLEYMKKYDLNCSKKECYRKLWHIRCKIDRKYWNSDSQDDLDKYLNYLLI